MMDKILERIEYAKNNNPKSLNLSKLKSPRIFRRIGDEDKEFLQQLETLDLSQSDIRDFSFLKHTKKLNKLDLGNSGLSKIPDEVFELKKLVSLKLNQNRIYRFDGLEKLKNIEYLDISDCGLREIPDSIIKIVSLQVLSAGNKVGNSNCFDKFPSKLGSWKNLKNLKLPNCGLESFPMSITGLKSLEILDLSENKFSSIPSEIALLSKLKTVHLYGNPIHYPPQEIVFSKERPNFTPVERIFKFFKEVKGSKRKNFLNELKLILVGEPRAGKSTLAESLQNIHFKFNENKQSTQGIEISKWEFLLDSDHEKTANNWEKRKSFINRLDIRPCLNQNQPNLFRMIVMKAIWTKALADSLVFS